MSKPRVLFCITVYNGEAIVPRAIESALRIDQSMADIDILILDDHSPAPGWSARLEKLCGDLGVEYYCSPRNLGIPRNVNLGLAAAVKRGYSHVLISNSDVIYPKNLINQMIRVGESETGIGSVMAWSNNVSIYSLENTDPDQYLADQDVVDWTSETLAGWFGDTSPSIPVGISFCILIPTDVVRDVGLMDPVFGRGYCEETDWSLRSIAAGYTIRLATGTFVYHQGRGSNLDAGLVVGDLTTVPENEAIIDMRYPQFRSTVGDYIHSGIGQKAMNDAIATIVRQAGTQFGYTVEVGWIPREYPDDRMVRVRVLPDGSEDKILMEFQGFRHYYVRSQESLKASLLEFFEREPEAVNMWDRSVSAVAASLGVDGQGDLHYPSKV